MECKIEVNHKTLKVQEGESLLSALRQHGFKIPTMCHMNRFSPTGACRLCVVEVEGKSDLITSCSFPVEAGMKVQTNSQRVIKARKSLVELLLSDHPDDCLYCQRNGHCELQWLAAEMNVKERKYFAGKQKDNPDYSSTSVARDPAKCVLCSRCVRICEEVQRVTAIDFISRGTRTKVNSAFHKGLNVSSCIHCGQCIQVCPTAALTDISHLEKVNAALGNKKKQVMFVISPAAIVSVTELIQSKSKNKVRARLTAALKRLGASKVFDSGTAADIHVMEEARQLAELIRSKDKKDLPLISSCCPSWIRYAEGFKPQLTQHIAKVKSPGHIAGSLIKLNYAREHDVAMEDIYTVSVTPCVAKKYEASWEENTHKGVSEVDAVLTVRELFLLLRSFGLNLEQIEEEEMDAPYNHSSAAAIKLGYSGGKAESVAQELFNIMGGSKKEAFRFMQPKSITSKRETKVKIGKTQVGFAWVSSIAEAEDYLNELGESKRDDIHYIEVMACLGGCAGGGGQPISRGFEQPKARKKISVEMEKKAAWQKASGNTMAADLFERFSFRQNEIWEDPF